MYFHIEDSKKLISANEWRAKYFSYWNEKIWYAVRIYIFSNLRNVLFANDINGDILFQITTTLNDQVWGMNQITEWTVSVHTQNS